MEAEIGARTRRRKPFSVTLVSILVLIFAVTHLFRFGKALTDYAFLESLLPFSPLYLVVTGLVWGLAGLIVAWRFWSGSPFGRWLLLGFVGLYSLYYWLDRTLMPGYAGRNSAWLYAAGVNLLIVIVLVWICTRPKLAEREKKMNVVEGNNGRG